MYLLWKIQTDVSASIQSILYWLEADQLWVAKDFPENKCWAPFIGCKAQQLHLQTPAAKDTYEHFPTTDIL